MSSRVSICYSSFINSSREKSELGWDWRRSSRCWGRAEPAPAPQISSWHSRREIEHLHPFCRHALQSYQPRRKVCLAWPCLESGYWSHSRKKRLIGLRKVLDQRARTRTQRNRSDNTQPGSKYSQWICPLLTVRSILCLKSDSPSLASRQPYL